MARALASDECHDGKPPATPRVRRSLAAGCRCVRRGETRSVLSASRVLRPYEAQTSIRKGSDARNPSVESAELEWAQIATVRRSAPVWHPAAEYPHPSNREVTVRGMRLFPC